MNMASAASTPCSDPTIPPVEATPSPARPAAQAQRRPLWRWAVLAWLACTVLVMGTAIAALGWFVTEVGVNQPIHIAIHGEEVLTVQDWRALSSGELLLVAGALLLAFMAVVILVPMAVLLGLAAVALGLVVGIVVPVFVLALVLAVFLSPLILLVWIVIHLLS